MSLVFGRGLGGDGAGAEIWSPLLTSTSPVAHASQTPLQSLHLGMELEADSIAGGDGARQMLPSLSSSAYLSR